MIKTATYSYSQRLWGHLCQFFFTSKTNRPAKCDFNQVGLKRMLSAKNAEQFKRSIKLELNEDFKMQSEFDKKKRKPFITAQQR